MHTLIGRFMSRFHSTATTTSPSCQHVGAVGMRRWSKPLNTSSMAAVVLLGVVGSSLPSQALTCPSSPPVSADNTLNIKDFGAVPDQGSALNVAPLLNCALEFAKAHNLRAIYFGHGTYTFNTPPQNIDFQITIGGDGKGRTILSRNYNASGPSEGLLTFLAGSSSSSVRDLGILAAKSSSHGSAISLLANESTAPDWSFFSNLYLSAEPGGKWDDTVFVDGRLRNNNSIGVRDLDFQNCSVFGAADGAMRLEGVEAFNFIGGGVFQAGGFLNTSGKILISPSFENLPGEFPSNYVNINTTFVDGILMQASQHGHFSAYFTAPITTSSFSVDNMVIGHITGGVEPFWQQSKYIDPEN